MSKLLYGAGYDTGGYYKKQDPAGGAWRSMLRRCYSEEQLAIRPTYIGCSVATEWLDFQVFAEWFYTHPYSRITGYHLDKDILVKGNKIYSSISCCYVPKSINTLFNDCRSSKGLYPQGVCKIKSSVSDKYVANMKKNGKQIYLGIFNTPEDASYVYRIAKEKYIREVALFYKSDISRDIFDTLINYKL